ncbi:hypothetical protein OVA07_14400 [Novosphingobium sp. SL115]|uniref:hypothetical protein n=1 Tax=Novosphingobium sp. SL115 TaxID=2995150 RepID=UPI002274ADF0|nr:hypothetical protein [Novosphingobium sp. SL115]MCY1672194.1 hypothetical protein [Novosphingobium sp. SL115]
MAGRFARIALALTGMTTAILPLAAEAQARPGWGGGNWNGSRGWHRDRGIDGGDVLAGILIIGGIAAIASAASKSQRDRDVREDDGYRYRSEDQPRYEDRQGGWQNQPQNQQSQRSATQGMDDAVDACVTEASRKGDVDEVYDAARVGSGYRVSGTLRNGDNFSCDVSAGGGVLLDLRRGAM